MKLLPRRGGADPASSSVPDAAGEPAAEPVGGGKGRPTPKRRDSTPQRGPVTAPKTRKEAYARQKQQARSAKAARQASSSGAPMTAQQRRAALRSGDPALLPRRDQGPTRKLARDYVDTHRMISNYLLLLFPLMVVSYLLPVLQFAVLACFLVIVGEWYIVGRRIHRLAVARFGSAEGSPLSIGFYAGSRAYLRRKWRLPAPQKELGEPI